MSDVFISYSRSDRPAAEAVAKALESQGLTVWWDRKIGAGETFDKRIEHELDSARCVIVLWSSSSVESEWVKNEAAVARERGVLLPVSIEAVRLPLEFRRRQAVDLCSWNAESPAAMTTLVQAVAGKLDSPVDLTALPSPSKKWSFRTKTLWLGLGVVGVAIAAGAVLLSSGRNSTDYTLVCRGGGSFGLKGDGVFGARIAFARGRSAATLEPGQCAWTDRPLNEREPTEMCYTGLRVFSLAKRFASDDLLRQQVHLEPANKCLRVASLG